MSVILHLVVWNCSFKHIRVSEHIRVVNIKILQQERRTYTKLILFTNRNWFCDSVKSLEFIVDGIFRQNDVKAF